MKKNPKREVLRKAIEQLGADHQFVPASRDQFSRHIHDGLIGTLAVGYSVSFIASIGRTSLSPVIGARNDEIDAVWAELFPDHPGRNSLGQIVESVEHLVPPRWLGYEYSVARDNSEMFARLSSHLATYGVPWLLKLRDLGQFMNEIAPKEHSFIWNKLEYLIALGVFKQRTSVHAEADRLMNDFGAPSSAADAHAIELMMRITKYF